MEQFPFYQESGCGWTKDETKPLVKVCFVFQCIDSDGLVVKRTSNPLKNLFHHFPVELSQKRWEMEGEHADPGSG